MVAIVGAAVVAGAPFLWFLGAAIRAGVVEGASLPQVLRWSGMAFVLCLLTGGPVGALAATSVRALLRRERR